MSEPVLGVSVPPESHFPRTIVNLRASTAQKRTVRFVINNFGKDDCARLKEELLGLDAESNTLPILLELSSKGGVIDSALLVHDFLRTEIKSPVTCLALEECSSSAIPILLGCTRRITTRNCTFLVHNPSLLFQRVIKPIDSRNESVAALLAAYDWLDGKKAQLLEVLSHRTSHPVEFWENIMNNEVSRMSGTEAFELGLVDEVL